VPVFHGEGVLGEAVLGEGVLGGPLLGVHKFACAEFGAASVAESLQNAGAGSVLVPKLRTEHVMDVNVAVDGADAVLIVCYSRPHRPESSRPVVAEV